MSGARLIREPLDDNEMGSGQLRRQSLVACDVGVGRNGKALPVVRARLAKLAVAALGVVALLYGPGLYNSLVYGQTPIEVARSLTGLDLPEDTPLDLREDHWGPSNNGQSAYVFRPPPGLYVPEQTACTLEGFQWGFLLLGHKHPFGVDRYIDYAKPACFRVLGDEASWTVVIFQRGYLTIFIYQG